LNGNPALNFKPWTISRSPPAGGIVRVGEQLHTTPQTLSGQIKLPGNWLTKHRIHSRSVGEFDDAALMQAFGREGCGIFMSASVLEAETTAQCGTLLVVRADEITEDFFAVSVERRISHPCVAAISQVARGQLLHDIGRKSA